MLELRTEFGDIIELDERSGVSLNKELNSVRSISKLTGSYTKNFTAPGSPNNNSILGHHYEIAVDSTFNPNIRLYVSLLEDSIPTHNGYLQLTKIIKEGEDVRYELTVYGSLSVFGKDLATNKLSDIDYSELDHVLNFSAVAGSLINLQNWHYVYPFLNTHNYTLASINGSGSTQAIPFKNLIPCLSVRYLWDRIFEGIGWTYDKTWFDEHPFFNNLIVTTGGLTYTKETIDSVSFKAIATTGTTFTTSQIEVIQLGFQNDSENGGYDQSNLWDGYGYTAPFQINASFELNINFIQAFCHAKWQIYKNGSLNWESPDTYFNPIVGNWNFVSKLFTMGAGDVYTHKLKIYMPFTSTFVCTIGSGSTLNINVSDQIDYGGTVKFNDVAQKYTITQTQFIQSIISMFNLYAVEDTTNGYNKHLIFKPRNEFYGTGQFRDWSSKLNRDDEINIELCSEAQTANIFLSFEEDADILSKNYKRKYNEIYGQYNYVTGNQFLSPSTTTEIKPAFTGAILKSIPGSNSLVAPVMFDLDNSGVAKVVNSKPKIMIFGGRHSCEGYAFVDPDGDLYNTKFWGFAGNIDSLANPSFALEFGEVQESYITLTGSSIFSGSTYPSNNLFTEYWESHLTEITDKDSKLISASFALSAYDALVVNYNDSIYVDGIYYKLNKLVYNYGDSLAKVELLKSNNVLPIRRSNRWVRQDSGAIINHARTIGHNNDVQNPLNTVVGCNNFVDQNSIYSYIFGDNNTVSASNTLIHGSNHSATTKYGLILGGSGNCINSSFQSSIIGGSGNIIESANDVYIFNSRQSYVSTGSTGSTIIASENVNMGFDSKNNYVLGGKNITFNSGVENSAAIGTRNLIISSSNTLYAESIIVTDLSSSPLKVIVAGTDGRLRSANISGVTDVASIGNGESIYYGFSGSTGTTHYIKSLSAGTGVYFTNENGQNIIINSSGSTSDPGYFTAGTGSNSLLWNNGTGNLAGGDYSLAIGSFNVVSFLGLQSSILGGGNNYINAAYSNIFGGRANTNLQSYSSIFGGVFNYNAGLSASLIGGYQNRIQFYGNFSTLGGGKNNNINSVVSFLGSGSGNTVNTNSKYSFIGNGVGNVSNSPYSIINNGLFNRILSGGSFNSIFNGSGNTINSNLRNTSIISISNQTALSSNTLYTDSFVARNLSGTTPAIVVAQSDGNIQRGIPYSLLTNLSQNGITGLTSIGGSHSIINNVSANIATLKGLSGGSNISITSGTSIGNCINLNSQINISTVSAVTSIQSNIYAFGTTGYKYIATGATYTTSAIESFILVDTPNAFTLTLQNKPLNYQFLYVKVGYSGNTYPVRIESEGGTHKFQGNTGLDIQASWSGVTLFYNAVQWLVVQ